jgi:C4-dicarboxylate transporter DctQ subunit
VLVHFLRTGDLPKHDHSFVEGLDEEVANVKGGQK